VRLSDFDYKQNTVRLITLKQKNKNVVRVISLSNSLINKILLYEKSKQLHNTDFLFTRKSGQRHISVQAVNKMVKLYFVNTLGEEYRKIGHPHTLRHSRVIQLLNSGVNIIHVKTILGHANIMNTLVYLKYSNRDIQESMRKSNLTLGIT
jgi:site-specific recombinase XerD